MKPWIATLIVMSGVLGFCYVASKLWGTVNAYCDEVIGIGNCIEGGADIDAQGNVTPLDFPGACQAVCKNGIIKDYYEVRH